MTAKISYLIILPSHREREMNNLTAAQLNYDSLEPNYGEDYSEWVETEGKDLARDFVYSMKAVPGLHTNHLEVLSICEEERDAFDLAGLYGDQREIHKAKDELQRAMVEAVTDMIEENAERCFNVWKTRQFA